MQFDEILAGRRSVKRYDAEHEISNAELKTLFEKVVRSPSSFNLQHWRFVVVRDPANKKALCRASWGQEQVETASVTIVVVGKLAAHEDAAEIMAGTAEGVRAKMLPMIHSFYADKPQMQRDEAVRSCSLAAMTLMYAAYDMGYATCPMIGFDPVAVSKLVGLDEGHIPVMLITLGKTGGSVRGLDHRYPPAKVVRFETLDGTGLS